MSRFLFCWELGGGLGHVAPLAPFAAELQRRGHEVLVASRDVNAAYTAYHQAGIPFIQAPYKAGPRKTAIKHPRFFGHILHTNGWAEPRELAALIMAWRGLFASFKPDVILFNHSPTALLAARGSSAGRALLGDGFCSPPATVPLPIIRPWKQHDHIRLLRDDEIITGVANQALAQVGGRRLPHLADIYQDVDANFMLTFGDIDPFGERPNTRYRGIFNTCPGRAPSWPKVAGKRVLAYLKPQQEMVRVLHAIARVGCPTLIHGTWVKEFLPLAPRFPTITLAADPIDIDIAATECDVAMLNGTHGMTATMLLAGKPILQLPIVVEQVLNARSTERLGAGLTARRDQPLEIEEKLRRLLYESSFAQCAQRFRGRYADFDAQAEVLKIVEEIETLGACAPLLR